MSGTLRTTGSDGNATEIWLPGMDKAVPLHVRQVSQAIEEYDSMLSLGKDKQTEEWVILRAGGPMDIPDFPVMGLGHNLPSADRVKTILYERDVARNGARIVNQVVRRQEQRRADAKARADAGAEAAGEALEWATRKMGGDTGVSRVFIPGRDD